MTRLWWVLPVAAVVVTVAGCGNDQPAENEDSSLPTMTQEAGPPSGPVRDIPARCGVQGVFWQGTWWIVDPPIQAVKNQSSTSTVSGTMTKTGNNQARLDSPDLVSPQVLSMQAGRTEDAPPFVACAPTAPAVN